MHHRDHDHRLARPHRTVELNQEAIEKIKRAHLLLAMFNALQPGVFALSGWDLCGMLTLKRSQVSGLLAQGDTRWIHRAAYDLMGLSARRRVAVEAAPWHQPVRIAAGTAQGWELVRLPAAQDPRCPYPLPDSHQHPGRYPARIEQRPPRDGPGARHRSGSGHGLELLPGDHRRNGHVGTPANRRHGD